MITNHKAAVAKDKTGSTPIDEAVSKGHAEVAALLIARGADIKIRNQETGGTPLHAAATKGLCDGCTIFPLARAAGF